MFKFRVTWFDVFGNSLDIAEFYAPSVSRGMRRASGLSSWSEHLNYSFTVEVHPIHSPLAGSYLGMLLDAKFSLWFDSLTRSQEVR